MAHDHHLLWTTRGQKTASKQHLDPQSLYNFFSNANAARARNGRPIQRIKSAAPRIGRMKHDSIVGSPLGSFASLRDPSPTPATSRPLSSRSGISSYSSRSVCKAKPTQSMSPSALYLGLHKTRCKSAPPRPADYYLPQSPKTAKSHAGSASSSSRIAAKRAWQNRTSSAKSQHSHLSREEVVERQRERCKSAPLPYDFISIDVVTSVPEDGSDIQRLKAFTRPLTCMPDVVQNVLSHNGLRHCCSAYQPRPKTTASLRQQFWPVARPAVFHRGDVPKYLHFVKPAGLWVKGEEIGRSTSPVDNLARTGDPLDVSAAGADLLFNGDDDFEKTVLYEEQFLIPATPSKASVSERECFENQEEMPDSKDIGNEAPSEAREPETMSPTINLVDEYLGDEEAGIGDPLTPDATLELKTGESQSDEKTDPIYQGFEVIITKVEHSPVQTPPPDVTEQEPETDMPNNELDGDLQIVVPDIPQWASKEEVASVEEEQNKNVPEEEDIMPQPTQDPGEPVEPVEPVNEVEDGPPKKEDKDCEVEETKPQMNQVKFADSLILTSYKQPPPKKEKKEQPKKPTSILKPAASKVESPSNEPEAPKVPVLSPLKKDSPVQRIKVSDKPLRLVKPLPVKPEGEVKEKAVSIQEEKAPAPVEEAKAAEERTEEPPKLEPEVLPKPEYIRAPGAYRMYDPKDLLEYHLEQKRESKPVKKSMTNPIVMPQFRPSPESTEVMTTILNEQRQKREGMKPWLQGRLALSKQTSRFELPMDVRLLEAMTPMDYLTKYCIISTRRKALYKHIFLKVDKDRDNLITFREMDRGLKEIHVDSITTEQVKKLIEMVEGNEKSTFNLAQFSAIAAFSERLLFSETQITEKKSIYSSKEILEEADFCGLKSKLSGFPVNATVRKILEVL